LGLAAPHGAPSGNAKAAW